MLNLCCKVVKSDKSNLGAGESVGLSNYSLASIFSQLDIRLGDCTGSGWDGVHFLHSCLYGAVVWVYDQNSVENTPVVDIVKQCLQGLQDLLFLTLLHTHHPPPGNRLGVWKRLEGGIQPGS